MTSVEGYGAIRFFDSIFYKTPHRGTWDSALTYNANQIFATFSRGFANWDYASERVYVSPFSWIDAGPNATSAFDDARPPEYVAEQLQAFRKWGMGGEFANYVYGAAGRLRLLALRGRDAGGDRSPARVDDADPTRRAHRGPPARRSRAPRTTTSRSGRCAGATIDGGSGVAEMNWEVLGRRLRLRV